MPATVTKIKGGILVECSCGEVHQIKYDEEKDEFLTKTTFAKKEEIKEPEKKTKKDSSLNKFFGD